MGVYDRWMKPAPGSDSKKKTVRTSRYGQGLRWVGELLSPNGIRHRKSFPSKDAAEAYVADRESDPRRGLYVVPNKVTLEDDMWPRWPGAKSQLGRTTLAGYDAAWKRDIEPKWASTPLAEIDRASVMEWLPTLRTRSKRELSPSWSRKVAITMRGLLDMGVDARLIPVNPLQRLGKALPQQKASERRYLSVAEVDALIAAMGDNPLPVRVLIMTGIRRGEMAGLQVRDLNSSRTRLRVERDVDADGDIDQTKTGRHRDVPLDPDLAAELQAVSKGRTRNDPLLPGPGGEAWRRNTWRPVWEKARRSAGLDELDTHELRHTAASLAIHSGANVKTVQRMLGHASASMTLDIYGHLWDDELDALPTRMVAHMNAEREKGAELSSRQSPPENVADAV